MYPLPHPHRERYNKKAKVERRETPLPTGTGTEPLMYKIYIKGKPPPSWVTLKKFRDTRRIELENENLMLQTGRCNIKKNLKRSHFT